MLLDLGEIEGCEILPDAARGVAVVVTDTPDTATDKDLFDRMESLESVAQAALVFAHAEVDA